MICARVPSGALLSACQSSPGKRFSRTTFRGRAAHAPPCGWKYWLFRAVAQVLTTVPHDRHDECPIVSPQFGNPCTEGRRFADRFGHFRRQQVASRTLERRRKPVQCRQRRQMRAALDALEREGGPRIDFDHAWLRYRQGLAYGYWVFIINETKFQTESTNTAYAARFGAAMVDHDTKRLLLA